MSAGRQIRLVPALLAALAVAGVVLPVRTLLTPNAWIRPTLLIVLVVLAVGLALRLLTRSALLVGAGQVALTLWAVINVCLSSTTWASLPTLATVVHQDWSRSTKPVLFKSCGWGGWDLAATRLALRQHQLGCLV